VKLAKQDRLQLIWVAANWDIAGNEAVDQLAKLGSECPRIGPEPACIISAGIEKTLSDWT
jgi:hypothetical protein